MRALTAILLLAASLSGPASAAERCGSRDGLSEELLLRHRAPARPLVRAAAAPRDEDVGDVAVLVDEGDLVVARNPFDLQRASLRFQENRARGYDAAALALPLEPAGDALDVASGPRRVDLPFAFPFFGRAHDHVFVHADGFLTFASPDPSLDAPSMSRMLGGPPRIAGLFADLDPARGGRVAVRASAERLVVLWDAVPGAGQFNRSTFQIALHSGGAVDLVWGDVEESGALVGVAPGDGRAFAFGDLSRGTPAGTAAALVERFSETDELDLVSTVHRFFETHADGFDQLVVYTARTVNPLAGSLAFEVNVRNAVDGIGLGLFDAGASWGSATALESVVFMDAVDPYLELDAFEFLGHEVGHRWGARLRLTPGSGSDPLLGRGNSHWSFFHDTEASVLEGNDIVDHGGGRFETTDVARRFSPLDQYAMGLRDTAEVPPFFVVEEPDDFRPNRPYKPSSAPEVGVSFTGRRREARIEEVVAALGPRDPARTEGPWRVAFVLVGDAAAAATAERVAAVGRIRARFEGYFRDATDGRGTAVTRLR